MIGATIRACSISAVLAVIVFAPIAPASAQTSVGSAFTYQGQLQRSGSPATSTCNLQFGLWDAASGGAQVGTTQAFDGVSVVNGLFTVAIDFGADQFTGGARWVQSAVRCAGDSSFTTLAPRQQVTAAPYALSLRPGAAIAGPVDTAVLRANNTGVGRGLWGSAIEGDGVYASRSTSTVWRG